MRVCWIALVVAVSLGNFLLLASAAKEDEECIQALPNGAKCPSTGQHLYPDEKHCSMYYECYDGCAFHTMCQGNYLYDAGRQWCNYPEMVDCGDRDCDDRPCKPHEPETDFRCPQTNGLFADPENCIKYYHCYENVPEHKTCQIQNGKQLYYDPDHEWCDWPERVTCGSRPICDVHDSNCSDQPAQSTPSPKPPTKCTAMGTCNEQGESMEEGHCQRCFCVCTNGHYEEICCQQGLVFNLAQSVCDWPFNVGC